MAKTLLIQQIFWTLCVFLQCHQLKLPLLELVQHQILLTMWHRHHPISLTLVDKLILPVLQEQLTLESLVIRHQIVLTTKLFQPVIQIYFQDGFNLGTIGLLIKMDGTHIHVTTIEHRQIAQFM